MGYLQNADGLGKNAQVILERILNSPSSITLSGLGEPILVTWYNINDKESNVVEGTETTDNLIGKDSGIKYNKIEKLAIYGVNKEIQSLELAPDDNGIMDSKWEIEPIIPPNTIIPTPYDYMVYRFNSGRVVMFRVNDTQVSTLKINGYYKVPMHMVEVDSEDYPEKIETQVIDKLIVDVERVGSNKKCIMRTDSYFLLKDLETLMRRIVEDYVDTFYIKRYNSFIFKDYCDGMGNIYDPYLTRFLTNHGILRYYPDILQPILIDQADDTIRKEYNMSIFRAIELRDWKRIKTVLYEVCEFKRSKTNPFKYWGDNTIYLLKLYQDKEIKYPQNKYMDFDWLYRINTIKESPTVSMIENLIIRYLQTTSFDNFLPKEDLEELERNIQEIEYTEVFFYLIPILIYILALYKDTLN